MRAPLLFEFKLSFVFEFFLSALVRVFASLYNGKYFVFHNLFYCFYSKKLYFNFVLADSRFLSLHSVDLLVLNDYYCDPHPLPPLASSAQDAKESAK